MHNFTETHEKEACPKCKIKHNIDDIASECEKVWWLDKEYVSYRCDCGYELNIRQE